MSQEVFLVFIVTVDVVVVVIEVFVVIIIVSNVGCAYSGGIGFGSSGSSRSISSGGSARNICG